MKLYFLRHGLAGDPTQWEGSDDLRPLTQKGKKQLKAAAETMALLDIKVDLILTSPLLRAVQTAKIAAKQLYKDKCIYIDTRLGREFSLEQLEAILKDHPQAEALMLVGHDPMFSQTIGALIGGGQIVCNKGSLARVDIPDPQVPKGELVWLLQPKVLNL